jgi:hypothetical protein
MDATEMRHERSVRIKAGEQSYLLARSKYDWTYALVIGETIQYDGGTVDETEAVLAHHEDD